MSLKAIQDGTTTPIELQTAIGGSLFTTEDVMRWGKQGRIFHAYVGSATTPVTLDASYANTDPDISVDAPDGRIIVPLCIRAIVEAYGSTALFEVFSLCSRTLCASSAGTLFQPINMRTRTGGGSGCEVYVGPTVTNGNTTGAFELGRETIAKVATVATGDDDSNMHSGVYEWNWRKNGIAPIMEGEASLATWVISQASSGYIQLWWAEFAEGEI